MNLLQYCQLGSNGAPQAGFLSPPLSCSAALRESSVIAVLGAVEIHIRGFPVAVLEHNTNHLNFSLVYRKNIRMSDKRD